MKRTLICGIGYLGRKILPGVKDLITAPHHQLIFAIPFKRKDTASYELVQIRISNSRFRHILSGKYSDDLAKKIATEFDKIIFVGNIATEEDSELILSVLARMRKAGKPYYSIITEPFTFYSDNIFIAQGAFQIINLTFKHSRYIKLQDYQFLYRKDSVITWNLIRKRITKIIEENLYL